MVLLIKQTRMKQTAVDWLFNEYIDRGLITIEAIKQAIEMEKQQIEDAYEIGFADAWDDARYDDEPTYAGAEQYYNKTYGDKTP
jgi:hypothetical protein